MTAEVSVSPEDSINNLLQALLPILNKAAPALIVSENLDPMATVVSGSSTLGKINLGICKASCKASYSIKNMTGLSSLEILTLTLDSCTQDSNNPITYNGTLSLTAKLNSTLSTKVSGKIKASCSGISDSASISGTAKAKGCTGKGHATFVATISDQICLKSMTLSSLSLNYSDIDIDIDGLGVFNSLLDPLVDALNDLFGSYIKSDLSDVVEGVLDDLLEDELPLCLPA